MSNDTMTMAEVMSLMPEDFEMKSLEAETILEAVKDQDWQAYRASLKGCSTVLKIKSLSIYLSERRTNEADHVRVINYINALKRGGLIIE